jgi:anti-sigma factor RsiW
MSCSPFDLRDYLFDELAQPDRRRVERHVHACTGCREELSRLQATHAALRSVADEEIPQRIAFVSDKVFAPSPWKRAAQAFWNSSARLGFVSAAMLSCALVVTALYRPAPAPAGPAPVSQVSQIEKARLEQLQSDFDRRVQDAVQKAVAESESRQAEKTAKLIRALEKQNEFDRQGLMVAVSQNMEVLRKERNLYMHAVNDLTGSREGGKQ